MMNLKNHQLSDNSVSDKGVYLVSNFRLLKEYGDLLTVTDLSKLTGLSTQTIRGECRAGSLPSCKIGRRYFIPKTLLIQYLEGGKRNG